jgi:SAM-dependent methyltransferase
MDATELAFGDSTFDNVLCIEAALHFTPRREFFQEACRVLRPGGRLAMLDFLCDYDLMVDAVAPVLPKENYLPNLDAYRKSMLEAGFRHVRVEDCTEFTITPATSYIIRMMERDFGKRPDFEVLEDIQQWTRHAKSLFAGAMVYAVK